jgi:hypothetical protein
MNQGITRRPLEFHDLDEVVRDAEALHAGGYRRAGQWNLAQVCGHLAYWLRFPMDGFPKAPPPIRALLWVLRHTIGRRALRRLLEGHPMPDGRPTMPETIPTPGRDEAAAVDRLRAVVARFKAHDGPLYPSPLFGPLDKPTATHLQLIHCAHHLSFLVPKNRASSAPADSGRTVA